MSSGTARTAKTSLRLIAVWLLLTALTAAIVLIEMRDQAAGREDAPLDEPWLLPVEITRVDAIEVMNKGTLHRFERDAAGAWFYHGIHAEVAPEHAHTTDPEGAVRIEKALIGLSRARKERRFQLKPEADEFGVTRPEIFITVYRPKDPQPLARYAVGIVAPDNVSRYVLPVGSAEVVTIADFHIGNLLGLIASFQGQSGSARPAPASR